MGGKQEEKGPSALSEVFLKKVQQRDFVVLPRLRATNTVSFVWIDLRGRREGRERC